MELLDGIQRRSSIRAFRPDPVAQETLQQIMHIALRAPSWTNCQPWEFSIVAGEALAELRRALVEEAASAPSGSPDIPPPTFTGDYDRRRREIGLKIYEVKSIPRDDQQKRQDWYLQGVQFFHAPVAIILYVDRSLNAWSILDAGHIAMLIMLAAQEFGLGTCPQTVPTRYPNVMRRVLGIPESKLILYSLALGYPDWNDPVNSLRSPRDPLERFVHWHGFE